MDAQDDLDVPIQEKAAAAALELQESLKLDPGVAVALVQDGLVALRKRQIVNPTKALLVVTAKNIHSPPPPVVRKPPPKPSIASRCCSCTWEWIQLCCLASAYDVYTVEVKGNSRSVK